MTESVGNVVPLNTTFKVVEKQNDYKPITSVYEMTRYVQSEIRSSKLKYKVIAKKADCCASTVSKLASGYTKDPRQGTVIRILMALGKSIYIR